MPFLRDVAHDGVSCTFSNRSSPDRGKQGVVRQGRRHGPSITHKITSCWVPLLRPARRAAVLNQPSSLRPHCFLLSVKKRIILCCRVELNAKGTAGTVTAFRKDASLLVNSSHHESG
jgi:hypothetical protein